VERKRVLESIRDSRLDKYYAYYCLLVKKGGRKQGKLIPTVSTSESVKNSIRMRVIPKTPQKTHRESEITMSKVKVSARGRTTSLRKTRLRREATVEADSPRRLLNSFMAIHGW
jgi:hypothetical protein